MENIRADCWYAYELDLFCIQHNDNHITYHTGDGEVKVYHMKLIDKALKEFVDICPDLCKLIEDKCKKYTGHKVDKIAGEDIDLFILNGERVNKLEYDMYKEYKK